jgi:protein required for attachment to host cells
MKNNTFLLIANASKARLYSLARARVLQEDANKNHLTLENEFEHQESRKKGKDLITDNPKGKFGHGAFGEEKNSKLHEAEHFAINLAQNLDSARKKHQEHEFIIAAPPAFLGLLKEHITKPTGKKISKMIIKDFTSHNENQLVADLQENL